MWGTMQSPVARNEDRSNKCCDNSSSELSRATHPHKNSQYVHSRVFQRNQSTTDVARRRNRNEKLYKAGARSSVTLAAQNADRRAAVSEIELALSTHCRRPREE